MAVRAGLRITVTQTRSASTINYSTQGRYGAINVNTVADLMRGQPLFTTASAPAFWAAVVQAVLTDITTVEE